MDQNEGSERVVRLLEEIRDLQRAQAARAEALDEVLALHQAVAEQQQAVQARQLALIERAERLNTTQASLVGRGRPAIMVALTLILVILGLIFWLVVRMVWRAG